MADEDLSSPDEPEVISAPTTKAATSTTNSAPMAKTRPVRVSLSESGEDSSPVISPIKVTPMSSIKSPMVLSPIKATFPQISHIKPKRPSPKPLKSAMEIELTESEDEGGPLVMGDEDIDGVTMNTDTTTDKKRRNDVFEPPMPETKKKQQAGLMLQFTSPLTPQKTHTISNEDGEASKEPSKDLPKREKKKKRKPKKIKPPKEEEESAAAMPAEGQETRNRKSVVSAEDPFCAIASLDAWLNSSSNDVVGDILYQINPFC